MSAFQGIVTLLLAVSPPDAELLAAQSRSALLEPPGCASLEADVTQNNRFLGAFRTRLTGRMVATLDHGSWKNFRLADMVYSNHSVQVGVRAGGMDLPVIPSLFGRLASQADEEVHEPGLFEKMETLLQSAAEMEFVSDGEGWNEEGWVLHQVFDQRRGLRGTRENALETLFTSAGLRPVAWRLEVHRPLEQHDKVRLAALSMTLRADANGLPMTEDLEARGRMGPFKIVVERSLRWHVVADCP
jgi:hypothetical protein